MRGIDAAKVDGVSSLFVVMLMIRVCNSIDRVRRGGANSDTAKVLGEGWISPRV